MTNSFTQVIRHLKWTDAMRSKVKKATRYPKILGRCRYHGRLGHDDEGRSRRDGLPERTGAGAAPRDDGADRHLRLLPEQLPLVIACLVGAYVMLRVSRAMSEGIRYRTDYLALHSPMFGNLIRKISLARFWCQTFAVLFTSGLEILKCLEAAKQTAGNLVLTEALERVKTNVQEGSPLSCCAQHFGRVPVAGRAHGQDRRGSGNLTGFSSRFRNSTTRT